VKKILWILVTTTVLIGMVSVPVQVQADGSGSPTCPTQKSGCKPLEVRALQS
jgi:hypothetical protein